MPKILFIQPTQYGADGTTLCKQKTIHLPGLAFALWPAYLPDHWEAEVLLEVVDDIDYDQEVDIVAIGAMGHAIFRGLEIAREFRGRGRTVVMGGYMVSIAAEIATEYADALVIGDADDLLPRLLADFEQGQLQPVYDDECRFPGGPSGSPYELLTANPSATCCRFRLGEAVRTAVPSVPSPVSTGESTWPAPWRTSSGHQGGAGLGFSGST